MTKASCQQKRYLQNIFPGRILAGNVTSSGYLTPTTQDWLKAGSAESQALPGPAFLETSLPIRAFSTPQDGPGHLRSVLRRGQRTEMLNLRGSLCRHPVNKGKILINIKLVFENCGLKYELVSSENNRKTKYDRNKLYVGRTKYTSYQQVINLILNWTKALNWSILIYNGIVLNGTTVEYPFKMVLKA